MLSHRPAGIGSAYNLAKSVPWNTHGHPGGRNRRKRGIGYQK